MAPSIRRDDCTPRRVEHDKTAIEAAIAAGAQPFGGKASGTHVLYLQASGRAKPIKLKDAKAQVTELGRYYNLHMSEGSKGLDTFARGTTERDGRTYAKNASGRDVLLRHFVKGALRLTKQGERYYKDNR